MKSLSFEKMQEIEGGLLGCFGEGALYLDALSADYDDLYFARLALTLAALTDCLNQM